MKAQDTAGSADCRGCRAINNGSFKTRAKQRRAPMADEMVRDRQAAVVSAKAPTNRGAAPTRLLAGISVPEGPLIMAAIEYAQRLSEPFLFNHAMRSWLFAELIGQTKDIDFDREVVAVGTILHDI